MHIQHVCIFKVQYLCNIQMQHEVIYIQNYSQKMYHLLRNMRMDINLHQTAVQTISEWS